MSVAISNPCRPGTGKFIVAEAGIHGWTVERTKRELEGLRAGSSSRMQEYVSDVRSENGIDIGQDGQTFFCKGRIRRG